MFGIGSGELLIILIIALFVLGPERMPRVARDIGRVVGDLRKTSDELRQEFLNADKIISNGAGGSSSSSAATSSPSVTPPAIPDVPGGASASSATPTEPETAFDREMREARERLKARREG